MQNTEPNNAVTYWNGKETKRNYLIVVAVYFFSLSNKNMMCVGESLKLHLLNTS